MHDKGQAIDEQTYVSTDETMITVRKKKQPEATCNAVVHRTNFAQLFLMEAVDHLHFQKKPRDALPHLYLEGGNQFIHTDRQQDIEAAVPWIQISEAPLRQR